MIAAEELGVELKDIKVIYSDTGVTPIDQGSYSSRVTLFTGNAVKSAASELKKIILDTAADRLEANIDDIEIKGGRVYVKGSPEKGIPFKEIVSYAQRSQRGKPLIATGSYTPPGGDPFEDRGDLFDTPASPTYSFGAHFAEVEIDKETGELKIANFIATHDCGFQINPMAVEGQLEGAVIMGSGYALTEELHIDNGIPLNPSFIGYKILTSTDMPNNISPIVVETIEPNGPFGAKEASEGILNPTPGAIANAVYNAIGVRIKDLPITPEKILKGLERR
jgi:CO/xanthine dehydrogenase Mo-binding subunit